jgi:hypothetical protein
MTTILQILKNARNLLKKKGWTQGANACNERGTEVGYTAENAATFCARGAVWHVDEGNDEAATRALALLSSCTISNLGLISWNDSPGRTKEEVLALFDRAIEKAEKEGHT